jgi:hypothetical protein
MSIIARERLHFADALEPEFLIKIQPVREVFGGTSLQKNGNGKPVFDRLTGIDAPNAAPSCHV